MKANDFNHPELSSEGEARREAILVAALGEAARLRFHRRIRRFAFTSVGLALITVAGWMGTHWPSSEPSRTVVEVPMVKPDSVGPDVAPSVRTEIARPIREVVITRIVTEPAISQKLSIPRTLPPVQRLDDAGLLRELAMQGFSSGVIVRHGQPELWWQLPRPPR